MNPFLLATKKQLRFNTTRGQLSVEDLWVIPLEALDSLAVSLDEAVAKASRKSFISTAKKRGNDDTLRFEVVKAVIDARLEDAEKAKARASRSAEAAFLKKAMQEKATNAILGLSADEMKARYEELTKEEGGDEATEE